MLGEAHRPSPRARVIASIASECRSLSCGERWGEMGRDGERWGEMGRDGDCSLLFSDLQEERASRETLHNATRDYGTSLLVAEASA